MFNPLIDLVIKRFLIGDAETANCITEWFDSIDEAVEFMMNVLMDGKKLSEYSGQISMGYDGLQE